MKKISLLLVGLLLTGCSKDHFSPKMKGIGFWEAPNVVEKQVNSKGLLGINTNCFSSFMILSVQSDWSDYQLDWKLSIGAPQVIRDRMTNSKFETHVLDEDITSVEWSETDLAHAQGAFEFNAFYGSGRIAFRSVKLNGEWVISYMAVPRKGASDDDNPYVIFKLSDEEIENFANQSTHSITASGGSE